MAGIRAATPNLTGLPEQLVPDIVAGRVGIALGPLEIDGDKEIVEGYADSDVQMAVFRLKQTVTWLRVDDETGEWHPFDPSTIELAP